MWYDQPKLLTIATDNINYFFTSLFCLECILRIIAFGFRYFRDGWKIFDFIIAYGSLIGVILQEFANITGAVSTTAIRTVRILRMFKIFRK